MNGKTSIENILTCRKGLAVERMHTQRHLIPYSNGHHSANAAIIGMMLCQRNHIDSSAVVKTLLLHDVHEGYTGDIPGNVKKENSEFGEAIRELELVWEFVHLRYVFPDMSPLEQNIVKSADALDLLFHCVEERELGNKTLDIVFIEASKWINPYEQIEGVDELLIYLNERYWNGC